MRKYKICPYCKFYIPETATLEGECREDEDVTSQAYCDCFERGKNKDGI